MPTLPRSLLLAVPAALAVTFPPALRADPPPGRFALLVGVNEYDHDDLKRLNYAAKDVTVMRDVLERAGYTVVLLTEAEAKDRGDEGLRPTKANVEAHLKKLADGFPKGGTLVVGLSGHGVQFNGEDDSFFCPTGARPFKDRTDTLVSIKWVYDRLARDAAAGAKLVLVDACRNDPDPNKGAKGGIGTDSVPAPPRGVAVLLSCAAHERSWESEKLGHGVFFYHVLQALSGDGDARDEDGNVTWDRLREYVKKRVPKDVPRLVRADLTQSPEEVGRLAGSPPVLVPSRVGKTYVSKATGMKFVRIKAGTFQMGSPAGEKGRLGNEARHEVRLTRDFDLGVYEVTRGQFRKFVDATRYKTEAEADGEGGFGYDAATGALEGPKPKYSWRYTGPNETEDHPVVNVTWNDAVKFAEWLSREDKKMYRLPTEAEWEYACRGGAASRYHFGDDEEGLAAYGNVADASLKARISGMTAIKANDGHVFAAPVGRFRANPFGLHDMHGNVWEWCSDWYGDYPAGKVADPTGAASGDGRVVRGGCWSVSARYCRAAARNSGDPANRQLLLGFRLARVVPGG